MLGLYTLLSSRINFTAKPPVLIFILVHVASNKSHTCLSVKRTEHAQLEYDFDLKIKKCFQYITMDVQ